MSLESALDVPVLTFDGLQAAFPDWRIWRSSAGRVWATRNGQYLTDEEHARGLCQTIDGDDIAALARELRQQVALGGSVPDGDA